MKLAQLGLLAALLAGGAVACSFAASDSAFADGTETPGTDSDAASPSGSLGGGNPNADVPSDNAVVLVHAAKSSAYRLCFRNELDRQPLPDAQTMPEANVVGVEVGSAVRLAPLKGPPGDIFLFDEPLIRAFYPQGGGAGPTCGDLLSANNVTLSKIAVNVGHLDTDLSFGVHLLVLTGCPGNGPIDTYSAAECGDDWKADVGNRQIIEIPLTGATRASDGSLPAQIVNLSKQLDNERAGRDLVVSFGDLTQSGPLPTTVASAPPLFGPASPTVPASLLFPSDDPAAYTKYGLRVGFSGADAGVLDQPLDLIQAQSSPQDLPATYYAAASNYAFLLLGDPAPKLDDGGADPDEKQNLHLLAISVISPKDGGVDGGDDDGGTDGATP